MNINIHTTRCLICRKWKKVKNSKKVNWWSRSEVVDTCLCLVVCFQAVFCDTFRISIPFFKGYAWSIICNLCEFFACVWYWGGRESKFAVAFGRCSLNVCQHVLQSNQKHTHIRRTHMFFDLFLISAVSIDWFRSHRIQSDSAAQVWKNIITI